MGYANEPSKLTIDIINENGVYSSPILNEQVQVSFGSFVFNGTVWAYNFKKNADESVLQVDIIDNSIILDRYYILLWKRGIFNDLGQASIKTKTISLQGEYVVVPERVGFTEFEFNEKQLQNQKISRQVFKPTKNIIGNIICIGTEKFPDTECSITDTDYSLDELKSVIGNIVQGVNFSAPTDFRATHEGTLREVLQSWAADCGFDFYWNFSTNSVVCYSVDRGIILSLPNIDTTSSLVEQSTSVSMEGTFRQYALAYTAYPKEPINTKSESIDLAYTVPINPFPISWFLSKNDTLQSLNLSQAEEGDSDDPSAAERNLWGGRTQDDFLKAAFMGYISEELRDLVMFINKFWQILGITIKSTGQTGADTGGGATSGASGELTTKDKNTVIDFLRTNGGLDLKELETIDETGVPNWNFYLCIKGDDLNSIWKQIEQDILKSYGSVYRHSVSGGSYYYCSATTMSEMTTTVTPAPDDIEPQSSDFKGRRIMRRSGVFSHDPAVARSLLGIDTEEFQEKLSKVRVREVDLVSTGLNKLFPNTKGLTLLIVPNNKLLEKHIGNFEISISTGVNKLETTTEDIAASKEDNAAFNCSMFDDHVKKAKCQSAKDEALDKEYARLGLGNTTTANELNAGLTNRKAKVASIKLNQQELKLAAPSYAQFEVVCNFNMNTSFVSIDQDPQKIFFNGSYDKYAQTDVAKIDVIYDNVTDAGEDGYGEARVKSIPLAKSIVNTSPQKNASYTFIGLPPSNLVLTPTNGLNSLDISYSSEGFKTTATFSSRPPLRTNVNTFLRKVQSQFNRVSFKAT
jgi:hypothetical protein